MSDRYLCKAKSTDGEWVEGYYAYYPKGMNETDDTRHTIRDTRTNPGKLYFVNPCTLCQCTGLTDKNGKKIWEGDILSAHLDDEYPDDVTYVEIKWNGFSWCTRESTEDDVMTEYDCNTFEVCGNIFDNPEIIPNYWKAVQSEN